MTQDTLRIWGWSHGDDPVFEQRQRNQIRRKISAMTSPRILRLDTTLDFFVSVTIKLFMNGIAKKEKRKGSKFEKQKRKSTTYFRSL